jgi:outer membrane protein OmpA-like peptidoglycan-associated protein
MVTTMNNPARLLFLSFVMLLFSICGCAGPRSQFVLLPSPDGHVGKVTVAAKAGVTTLSNAYESALLASSDDHPSPPVVISEEKAGSLFKEALAAQPAVPVTYLLYFEPASSILTKESEDLLPRIVDYIRKTNSSDIGISGHSDRVGSRDVNIRISRERAEAVARRLAGMGVELESLDVASYGMELPLIDTPEGVPEPRNRRVEIVVR